MVCARKRDRAKLPKFLERRVFPDRIAGDKHDAPYILLLMTSDISTDGIQFGELVATSWILWAISFVQCRRAGKLELPGEESCHVHTGRHIRVMAESSRMGKLVRAKSPIT